MSTEQQINRRPPAPAWQLWANPIVRRYATSRLRLQGFGIMLLIVMLIATFLFVAIRTGFQQQLGMSPSDVERTPLIALLVLQGLILFLLGTGQVAGAMTGEADEGVLDYQRLAPMTPLAKVLGYLFGLPIREYALVFATAPFTIWCLWRGQVPLGVSLQLYGAFFLSAILYHLTGLVAGTVVKNRRWAFLVSMALVFFLYTVMPYIAKFGLPYFKYLTLYPVFEDSVRYLIPREAGAAVQTAQNLIPDAKFFNIDLPQYVFTFLSQGVLILTGLVMLWRRWRRSESHLLGKAWAVGLFGWIQLLLLGNALPLLDSGLLFPSRGFNRRFGGSNWQPQFWEAMAMIAVYGLVTIFILWALTVMITPTREGQLRGWRRARKLGRKSLAPLSDPATAFWSVGIMVAIGSVGWIVFARELMASRWFPGWEPSATMPIAFALTLFAGGIGLHALLESKGGQIVALVAVLLGFVPIGLSIIARLTGTGRSSLAVWLMGMSPFSGPVFGSAGALPPGELPIELARAVPGAFWFWQGVLALAAVWLLLGLVRSRREIARLSQDEKVVLGEPAR